MLKKIFNKIFLQDISNWKYWLFIAFAIRGLFFAFQIHVFRSENGFWGIFPDSVDDYFISIENLVSKGTYSPDFRMPGYGLIYLPFCIFFSKTTAFNLMILLQVILSSISVYALALTAKMVFKRAVFFHLTFFLFAISYFNSSFDTWLLTESYTTSLLIFAIYYFASYFYNKNKKTNLLFAGIFLTWVIFIRPGYALLPFAFLAVLISEGIKDRKKLFKNSLLFLLPLVLVDGAWIIRNYIYYQRIIPLTKTVYLPYYDQVYVPSDQFVQAWGGGVARDYKNLDFTGVPDYIYTSEFNADSLKIINKLKLADYRVSPEQKEINHKLIVKKLTAYTQSIRNEKPLLYYVKAPLLQASGLLKISRVWYFLFFVKKLGSIIWYFYLILYYAVIYLGSGGMLLLAKKCIKEPMMCFIAIIPLYTIVTHSFILRLSEYRYFVPAFPYMLLCALYASVWLYDKTMNLKGQQVKHP
jgi:hypothetical protein